MAEEHPAVLVTDTNIVAGRGLVAQREFKTGDLILQEDALLICRTGKAYKKWKRDTSILQKEERDGALERLTEAYNRLETADRVAFKNLFTPEPGHTNLQRILDSFHRNVFDFRPTHKDWSHFTVRLAVYRTISFANHSCIPNAILHIDTRDSPGSTTQGQGRLVATQDIPIGGEIVINYTSKDWNHDGVIRRAVLKEGWRFNCACKVCEGELANVDASERDLCTTYHESLASLDISKLRFYSALLSQLGVWTDDLSGACLLWARRALAKEQHKMAYALARCGVLVEKHFYVPIYRNQLVSLRDQCSSEDPSTGEEEGEDKERQLNDWFFLRYVGLIVQEP